MTHFLKRTWPAIALLLITGCIIYGLPDLGIGARLRPEVGSWWLKYLQWTFPLVSWIWLRWIYLETEQRRAEFFSELSAVLGLLAGWILAAPACLMIIGTVLSLFSHALWVASFPLQALGVPEIPAILMTPVLIVIIGLQAPIQLRRRRRRKEPIQKSIDMPEINHRPVDRFLKTAHQPIEEIENWKLLNNPSLQNLIYSDDYRCKLQVNDLSLARCLRDDYGTIASNPIRVNGAIGALCYLSRLRVSLCPMGTLAHRIGFINTIQVFEVCAELLSQSKWDILFLDVMWNEPDKLAPNGYLLTAACKGLTASYAPIKKFPDEAYAAVQNSSTLLLGFDATKERLKHHDVRWDLKGEWSEHYAAPGAGEIPADYLAKKSLLLKHKDFRTLDQREPLS